MLAANPLSVIGTILKSVLGALSGNPCTKAYYLESLKMLFDIFQFARKNGTAIRIQITRRHYARGRHTQVIAEEMQHVTNRRERHRRASPRGDDSRNRVDNGSRCATRAGHRSSRAWSGNNRLNRLARKWALRWSAPSSAFCFPMALYRRSPPKAWRQPLPSSTCGVRFRIKYDRKAG
jgi:hypothetical protein